MSKRNLNLPEPVLPEHVLIRDSAPIPEFSAGFKSRVLSECKTSIAKSTRMRRWKYAGATTVVCCLGLLFCISLPKGDQPTNMVVQPTPSTPSHYTSPGSLGVPSAVGGMAVDMPKPTSVVEPERSQMNQIIDTLNNRGKLLDANMLGL